MQLSDVYLALGRDGFAELMRNVSIGRLKTYQIYEGFKVRARLHKLNTESLRKAVPRFLTRLEERDEEFARDLAQVVLVSRLDMISAVLDGLGVPHENGFFSKDIDAKPYFTDGWEKQTLEKFRDLYPEPLLVFYINHLRWELLKASDLFRPVPGTAA
jgi:hypothetical protein